MSSEGKVWALGLTLGAIVFLFGFYTVQSHETARRCLADYTPAQCGARWGRP